MKTLTQWIAPLTLAGMTGMTGTAMADDGSLTQDDLLRLLDGAEAYGFSHYEEFDLDDGHRLELEGWRDDGWRLEVDMRTEDGNLLHEAQRQSQIPDWSLTGDQLRQALANAHRAGLQRFSTLDVDDGGTIEIEGRDADDREIELRLDHNMKVTGVEND
ncbi:PepSY domain-containing protein [Halomonas organivorans]|uniref:PepSY domain-containing protein n=1 Tax=Halomonas organivorans TaxID=257772 RepID=A0A7W5BVH8_9GAMM|nr:PepSY domain-containing protein [Halomonas organivorans]MBB3139584.1 hypothetical protein [Halomonas organivorans]